MLIYEIDRKLFRAECEAKGRAEIIEKIVVNALKENCSLVLLSKITQTSVKKIKAIAKKHKIEIDE